MKFFDKETMCVICVGIIFFIIMPFTIINTAEFTDSKDLHKCPQCMHRVKMWSKICKRCDLKFERHTTIREREEEEYRRMESEKEKEEKESK